MVTIRIGFALVLSGALVVGILGYYTLTTLDEVLGLLLMFAAFITWAGAHILIRVWDRAGLRW